MKKNNQVIAVCGLICSGCDIMEASTNSEIAKQIVDWFKKEKNIVIKIEDVQCQGCRGDRNRHWASDCWILKCCVDERGFKFCNECPEFPCEKLVEWTKGSKRYEEALNRLKEMKDH